jgi:lipopolysaccharide/colanic/teichoic acid biosynthesis glycosyltransferase
MSLVLRKIVDQESAPRDVIARLTSEHEGENPSTWHAGGKRLCDIVFSLLLLAPALPLIGLCVFLVRLTSPGPGLYRQTRVGRRGRLYQIIKIRTMYHNCEGDSGPKWSHAGDPRVTPLGRFLRRTHLDELPQLWNVLRGDMSLVGPRPERPEFIPTLARAIPRYCERLTVRPGVTGLAQVQLPPDSDLNSVRRKLAYDLYYTQHQGLWLDLRLLLATAGKVLGIPFRWTRMILRLPSGPAIENAARNQDKTTPPTPQLTLVLQNG